MKIQFVAFLFLLLSKTLWCTAQWNLDEQSAIDSLTAIFKQTASDSIRARVSFSLSAHYARIDTAKAVHYLEQGRKFGNGNPYLEALYYYYVHTYCVDKDHERAEAVILKADTLLGRFKTKEAFSFRAVAWHNYGILQQMKDDDKAYLDILLNKSIPLAEQGEDTITLGANYRSVGAIFNSNGQFEKSAIYYEKAIPLLKGSPPAVRAYTYSNIAESYVHLKKYALAKKMLDDARTLLAPYPKAEIFIDYYKSEGLYYYERQQYDSTINSLDKGIALAKALKQESYLPVLTIKKYEALTRQKKYETAKQALLAIMDNPATKLAKNSTWFYEELAKTYARLGNMALAYKWMQQYAILSDSVNNSRLKNDLHAMEIKYRSLENEKKITALRSENEKVALSLNNNRLMNWLLGSVSMLLLVITAFSLLFYKNNKKLSVQKELNYQQRLKEIEQQQKIRFTQAMLQGEEQERKRMAGDLHDGLGGMLAGIKMNLSKLTGNTPAEVLDAELPKITHRLDHSLNELRRIARNMMPETLVKFGLETALADLCESITSPPHITFQPFDIQPTLPPQTQMIIYRIIQELLSNAVRHAQAATILVQCSQNNGTFFITVEDNGKGFDTTLVNDAMGLGFTNVKSRVDYLGGKMELASFINEGTSVNIELNVVGK